ncbi:MAG: hypothetical protein AB7O88_27785 [Reyranellaceae bacterium]
MDRIVRPRLEPQLEATDLGASADMPSLVAIGRTVGETLESAEIIVRTLIANAGFAFDPPVVLA